MVLCRLTSHRDVPPTPGALMGPRFNRFMSQQRCCLTGARASVPCRRRHPTGTASSSSSSSSSSSRTASSSSTPTSSLRTTRWLQLLPRRCGGAPQGSRALPPPRGAIWGCGVPFGCPLQRRAVMSAATGARQEAPGGASVPCHVIVSPLPAPPRCRATAIQVAPPLPQTHGADDPTAAPPHKAHLVGPRFAQPARFTRTVVITERAHGSRVLPCQHRHHRCRGLAPAGAACAAAYAASPSSQCLKVIPRGVCTHTTPMGDTSLQFLRGATGGGGGSSGGGWGDG